MLFTWSLPRAVHHGSEDCPYHLARPGVSRESMSWYTEIVLVRAAKALCLTAWLSHSQVMSRNAWRLENAVIYAKFINACLRKTRKSSTSDQPGLAGRDVI